MFKGAETKKEEFATEDLISFGGQEEILRALGMIHPGIPGYNNKEIVLLLNYANVTKKELKGLIDMKKRSLEKDKKNELDFNENFYDIRKRLDDAISKIESEEIAA